MAMTSSTMPFLRHRALLFFIGVLWAVLLATGSMAANPPEGETPMAPSSPEAVKQLLENALDSERSNLADIEQNLKRWESLRASVASEIEAYRIQNAAHGNLLLVLQTRVEDLQTALNNNRLAIKSLSERITEFEKIGETASGRMAQLAERIAIAEKQMADLQQEGLPAADRRELKNKFSRLLAILQEKQQHGKAFLEAYEKLFGRMKAVSDDLQATRKRLEERLRVEVQTNLYERTSQPFARLTPHNLADELTFIRERLAALAKMGFWRQQWANFQRSGGFAQAFFLLLFVIALLLRRPIRRYGPSVEERLATPEGRYRRLTLILVRRSFVLLCAAAILWLYDVLKLPHMNFSLARFLNQTVFTLLALRWGIDFLKHDGDSPATVLQVFVRKRLVHLLQWVRLLAVAYLALVWVAGSVSQLVWLARLVLELGLLAWVVLFWRDFRPAVAQGRDEGETIPSRSRLWLVWTTSYLMAGGALLMEVAGYRVFAGHWLVAWAQTLLLGMWAFIAWRVIQEWHAAQRTAPRDPKETGLPAVAAPVGWFLAQMARLVWLGAMLVGALLIWSSREATTATVTEVFNLAFAVGSLSFSVKGLLLAVVILCATHVATRIGRRFLREKVLSGRDFERGLKDSVVTITSYLVWGLGLVLSLGVLGVNATSLAVVFGALSIGIGFGLQNIFNNFISGLILLFERPIQVGDYVEVGGLWAEVKEINVRATIVQTFDNASVIIPNSEFISQQVTNWSFKDPRMRRHVDVGVAYGSDTELVRDTLLAIADDTPQVLKFPKPDVLFLDHADSALVFRVRYWAHVDNFYSTSTAIRFELDRRFRELGIEIAFPQRDLHLRSVPANYPATAAVSASPEPPPQGAAASDQSRADS